MKVAVLILAHKNKEQLQRLISKLNHPFIDFYIHLDKKCSFDELDIKYNNIYFTENRFDIVPFSFSMVDAEMELLRTATKNDKYAYYILLSGQCYPLRHIDDIYNYLVKKYPEPLIEVISPEIVDKFKKQFQLPYVMKRFRSKSEIFLRKHLYPKSIYPYKYIPELIAYGASLFKGIFIKSPKQRLKKMGIEPYFGPQWWILPDITIEEIFKLYENKEFHDCMKDCFSCDETFFQTAIMVNRERFNIELNKNGYYLNKKWFTIFSHGHPIIFKQEHFDQLISSKMLFARKFDVNTDSEILDMLDRNSMELLNEEILD